MSNPLKWKLHPSGAKFYTFTSDGYGYHLYAEPDGVRWYANVVNPQGRLIELHALNVFDLMKLAQHHYDLRPEAQRPLQDLRDAENVTSAVKA